VLLNAHPRRQHEEAWLTYGGTRVAVARTRSALGVSFASGDGKVQWHEMATRRRCSSPACSTRPCSAVAGRPAR